MKPFWYYRPAEDFPPPSIRLPEERRDGDRLCIVCTQTNLAAKQQRELISQWCEELPRLQQVRWLWLSSRVPQTLFDAACRMPHLEGLWIKWMAGESIGAMSENKSLRYVHLGNCASLLSLEPLSDMTQLAWLGIEHFPKVDSIDPLAGLIDLTGLTIEGSMLATQRIQSIRALKGMRKLRYLSLANVRVTDNLLEPLMGMRELEALILPKWWDQEMVTAVRRLNPGLAN
jgi:hypothetical protein